MPPSSTARPFPDDNPARPLIQDEAGENGATPTDPEYFIRLAFGQDPRRGLELLFRQYYKPLCSHAVRFVYARTIGEELVSEVFYQFWRTSAYQTVRGTFLSYLFTAVRNEAFTYLRREFKKTDLTEVGEAALPSLLPPPDAEVHYNQLLQTVNQAIGQLPPQCQRVFVLHRFENKKYHEIAAELRISPKTVEVHISKALRHLRDVLRHGWLVVFFCARFFF